MQVIGRVCMLRKICTSRNNVDPGFNACEFRNVRERGLQMTKKEKEKDWLIV